MDILQLIQDVKTRWSSTGFMIERALNNRKVVSFVISFAFCGATYTVFAASRCFSDQ